jgi:hypothetical protein
MEIELLLRSTVAMLLKSILLFSGMAMPQFEVLCQAFFQESGEKGLKPPPIGRRFFRWFVLLLNGRKGSNSFFAEN